jgi:hypothetical protein
MPTTDYAHHVLDTDIPVFKPLPGVFKKRELSEILYSLEKGEIPGKYMYFNKGIDTWKARSVNKIEEVGAFKFNSIYSKEYEMINSNLNLVLGAASDKYNINVVDIGPGTGYPVFPILSYLQEKKKLDKYITIDIVEDLCDLAIENLRSTNTLKDMVVRKYVHDFEDGHFADLMLKERKIGTVNLFIFIGATLGNMVDRHRALANIRDSMTEGDMLWVSIPLGINTVKVVDMFAELEINSPRYFELCSLFTSSLVSLGLLDWSEYGKIVVKEVDGFGLLKYDFEVKKPFFIEFPEIKNLDKPVKLKYQEGEKITLLRQKNYENQDLVKEFRETGFKIKMLNVSDDYRRGLVLATV